MWVFKVSSSPHTSHDIFHLHFRQTKSHIYHRNKFDKFKYSIVQVHQISIHLKGPHWVLQRQTKLFIQSIVVFSFCFSSTVTVLILVSKLSSKYLTVFLKSLFPFSEISILILRALVSSSSTARVSCWKAHIPFFLDVHFVLNSQSLGCLLFCFCHYFCHIQFSCK